MYGMQQGRTAILFSARPEGPFGTTDMRTGAPSLIDGTERERERESPFSLFTFVCVRISAQFHRPAPLNVRVLKYRL
jgi:hypothetical protein